MFLLNSLCIFKERKIICLVQVLDAEGKYPWNPLHIGVKNPPEDQKVSAEMCMICLHVSSNLREKKKEQLSSVLRNN
jgi:hypothetical protein